MNTLTPATNQPTGPPAVADIRYLNDVVSFVCVFMLILIGYIGGLEVLTRWLS